MWGCFSNFMICTSLKIFFKFSSSSWVLSTIFIATWKEKTKDRVSERTNTKALFPLGFKNHRVIWSQVASHKYRWDCTQVALRTHLTSDCSDHIRRWSDKCGYILTAIPRWNTAHSTYVFSVSGRTIWYKSVNENECETTGHPLFYFGYCMLYFVCSRAFK